MSIKGPVTQAWTHALPFMQQTVLLTAVRGPDGIPKYHPAKFLLRWYRRCILVSSLDGCVLDNPSDDRGGSFMGPSYGEADMKILYEDWDPARWQEPMDRRVGQYLQSTDELPHHFQLHFMHAAEIVGYKHPDEWIRFWWAAVYERLVNDMHLHRETMEELDGRLSDSREGWLARADPATVA